MSERWDYHDPTARIAGAPPARSALTLRLILASYGVFVCAAGVVVFTVVRAEAWLAVIFAALGGAALLDFAVIIRRKRRGEPG